MSIGTIVSDSLMGLNGFEDKKRNGRGELYQQTQKMIVFYLTENICNWYCNRDTCVYVKKQGIKEGLFPDG